MSELGRKVGYLWQNILNFKRLAVGDRREAFSSIWIHVKTGTEAITKNYGTPHSREKQFFL